MQKGSRFPICPLCLCILLQCLPGSSLGYSMCVCLCKLGIKSRVLYMPSMQPCHQATFLSFHWNCIKFYYLTMTDWIFGHLAVAANLQPLTKSRSKNKTTTSSTHVSLVFRLHPQMFFKSELLFICFIYALRFSKLIPNSGDHMGCQRSKLFSFMQGKLLTQCSISPTPISYLL